MCGRFTLTQEAPSIRKAFNLPESILKRWKPRYNIAPGQPVCAITADRGRRVFEPLRWGLVPSWAKDPAMGARLINARAETVHEKPAFRGPARNGRCLILADGFYEWKTEGGRKTPHYIRLKTHEPFAFAGLVSRWTGPDGSEIHSCGMITCEANDKLRTIHLRMPVILLGEAKEAWIGRPVCYNDKLGDLLKAMPSAAFEAYPVASWVNSPGNDSAACIAPVRAAEGATGGA